MGDNFKIILEAMIDQSSLTNAQKQVAKERLKIGADISVEDFAKSKQAIEKQMVDLAKGIKTILGDAISDKQATQWANQYYKQMVDGAKQAEKQLAKEAELRQRNLELAQKQDAANRKTALDYTKNASKKLSDAVSKYSYGDSAEANKMIKQMNRGVSNFGNLDDIKGDAEKLSSVIDKIIADLKKSHEESLRALNEEIKAEQELQELKDKSIYNGIDESIAQREKESKKFAEGLKHQMQENAKIQLQIDDGTYDAKVSDLIAKTNQWTDASGQTRVNIEKLNEAYQKFANADNDQDKIEAAKQLDIAMKETANSVRKMNAEYAKDSEISSLHQRVQEFYDKNSATHRKWGAQLKSILDQTGVGAKLSKQELQKLSDEFINIGNSARQAGKLGQSFWDKLKSGVKTFTQWTSATSLVMKGWQITKDMIQNVRDFDDSLLELVKVSDLSAEGLEKVADKAYDLGERVGRTGKQVVDAVTEFKRAGFELNDSMDMAESALVMTNVAEGIDDTADAAGTLISVLKGYNMSESETMSIVDKINQVSNTSPIGFDQIAEGLERTAGTMAQSGTTIDETIGLITAGYAQLRNVEKVSTSLITLSARLRGVDENGDVIDGLSAELQDSFGKIGVAIEDADGNLRSIYAIAKDYAEVLPTLSSKQKQYYAELAAGKRNVTTWNAITQQFQDAEHAVAESLNSVGSAAEENEKYLNSVSGKVTLFESAVEDLSNSAIDSDFIKFIVDLGTIGVKGLDGFIEKFGMLTTLLTTGGLVAGIKNVGQEHRVLADIAYPC